MVRKVTPSQLRSMVRQAEQKRRQAINKHNAAVRKHNAEVERNRQKYNAAVRKHNAAVNKAEQQNKRAIADHNREVRAYNNRVRAHNARLKSEMARLNSRSTTTYVTLKATTMGLASSFNQLDGAFPEGSQNSLVNELLDLSEREAANSVGLLNALDGDPSEISETEFDQESDNSLQVFLGTISQDIMDRWKGAIFALNPQNPDAARHFCTSTREVIISILDTFAPDADVLATFPDCERHTDGRPIRRYKLKYLLKKKNASNNELEAFADADIDDVLSLFKTFNEGTHGSAGKFSMLQLKIIRKRVEDAISFLRKIVA